MKLYVIAGEASGDLHGSNLIKAIRQEEQEVQIRGWGGNLMEEAGMELIKHYRDLAFMGFLEVVSNLRTIKRNFDTCKQDIEQFQPDAVILIDYPGFNLRMAKWIHGRGIKVLYYISPQIWAWNQGRVKKIKEVVDKMYVILPFEKAFYESHDVEVDFVGHPLLDAISTYRSEKVDEAFRKRYGLDERKIIAILPGSRKQEIQKMLPTMLEAAIGIDDAQFVIAGAPSVTNDFYESFHPGEDVKIVQNETYKLLSISHAAMVTSGTATLETALFRVPEVVCYKGNYISYLLARMLIKVKYISLVNLIVDREIVRELIQSEFNIKQLKAELKRIVDAGSYRSEMLKNMDELAEKLGGQGASENAAKLMIRYLKG